MLFRSEDEPPKQHTITFSQSSAIRSSSASSNSLPIPPPKLSIPEDIFESDDELVEYGFPESSDNDDEGQPQTSTTLPSSNSPAILSPEGFRRFFVVHGGLFSKDDVSLDEIRKIPRVGKQPDAQDLMCE